MAELVAQVGVLSDIYGGTSTEGGIERAMKDIGAPADIAKSAERSGVDGVLRAWVTNQAIDIPSLLRAAPRRAAQSVTRVLKDAKSTDPDKVLRNAGHGDLLGLKQHLTKGAPQPGDKRADGKVWTGKRWL
jgi:hypothetical protein